MPQVFEVFIFQENVSKNNYINCKRVSMLHVGHDD